MPAPVISCFVMFMCRLVEVCDSKITHLHRPRNSGKKIHQRHPLSPISFFFSSSVNWGSRRHRAFIMHCYDRSVEVVILTIKMTTADHKKTRSVTSRGKYPQITDVSPLVDNAAPQPPIIQRNNWDLNDNSSAGASSVIHNVFFHCHFPLMKSVGNDTLIVSLKSPQ